MSKYIDMYNKNLCYDYLDNFIDINDSMNYIFSNLNLSLLIHYGSQFFDQQYKFNNIYIYKRLIKIFFKYSINKKLLFDQLVYNNISTNNIDRSNIIFKRNIDLLHQHAIL